MAAPLSSSQFSASDDPSNDGTPRYAGSLPSAISGSHTEGQIPEPHDSQTQTSLGRMFSWRQQQGTPLSSASNGTFMRPQ